MSKECEACFKPYDGLSGEPWCDRCIEIWPHLTAECWHPDCTKRATEHEQGHPSVCRGHVDWYYDRLKRIHGIK